MVYHYAGHRDIYRVALFFHLVLLEDIASRSE